MTNRKSHRLFRLVPKSTTVPQQKATVTLGFATLSSFKRKCFAGVTILQKALSFFIFVCLHTFIVGRLS